MATLYSTLAASATLKPITSHMAGVQAGNASPPLFEGRRLVLRSAFQGEQLRRRQTLPLPESRSRRVCASLDEYAPLTAAVYGACLLGGGLFAYTKTGSKGSLGGGVLGGIALGVAYFLMQVPETRDLGEAVGFGSAVLFAAIFAIRLAATGKPVPAGPLLGLSAATSVVFALSYLQTRVLLP